MSPQLALLGTVLLASLAGSLHCAGMCGAFLAFAVGKSDAGPSRSSLQLSYHAGRLVTYTTLGVLAGVLGRTINLGGEFVGYQQTASIIAASLIITVGLIGLARALGLRVARVGLPSPMIALATRAHEKAAVLPPRRRAFAVGLITTLLPCGWLYAFVVVSAGTADPLFGGATMLAFWIGTLPVLVSLGATAQALLSRFGRRVPAMLSTLIIVAGLTTLLLRTSVAMPDVGNSSPADRASALYEDGAQCRQEPTVDDD